MCLETDKHNWGAHLVGFLRHVTNRPCGARGICSSAWDECEGYAKVDIVVALQSNRLCLHTGTISKHQIAHFIWNYCMTIVWKSYLVKQYSRHAFNYARKKSSTCCHGKVPMGLLQMFIGIRRACRCPTELSSIFKELASFAWLLPAWQLPEKNGLCSWS